MSGSPDTLIDTLIIGGSLSGLCAARRLACEGKSVLVLERDRIVAGEILGEDRDGFKVESGHLFFSNPELPDFIRRELDLDLTFQESDAFPILFDGHQFKTFQPSGSEPTEEVLAFESLYKKAHKRFLPGEGLHAVVDSLLHPASKLQVKMETWVTDLQIEDGRLTGVTVNTGEGLKVGSAIWASPLEDLIPLLRRNPSCASLLEFMKPLVRELRSPELLVLEFGLRGTLSDYQETIFIPHSKKEPSKGHLVGHFPSNLVQGLAPQGKQLTTWFTLLSPEEIDDNNEIAKKIRHCKRLITKAFPAFPNLIQWEKLSMSQAFHSPHPIGFSSNEILSNFHFTGNWITESQISETPLEGMETLDLGVINGIQSAKALMTGLPTTP